MELYQRISELLLEAAEEKSMYEGNIDFDGETVDVLSPFYMSTWHDLRWIERNSAQHRGEGCAAIADEVVPALPLREVPAASRTPLRQHAESPGANPL